METKEGSLDPSNMNFAIILSRFNEFIGKQLLEGAISELKKKGVDEEKINVFKVPGAYEIPLAAETAARSGKYHAIICLGAVIRGETPHFDYVAGAASNGILQVGLKYQIPVIFGVLTTDNVEQAAERADPKAGNKGGECALAAIEMANLIKMI